MIERGSRTECSGSSNSSARQDACADISPCGSGVTVADVSMVLDMDVVNVLFGFNCLAGGLAEYRAQLGGCLLPLRAAQPLGTNDELAFGGDGDDQLGHWCVQLETDADRERAIEGNTSVHTADIALSRRLRQQIGFGAAISGPQIL